MKVENCPKCGGTHFGSYVCPFTDVEAEEHRAALTKPPMKLHFTNEWLRAKIEQDGDDFPETVP